MHVMSKREAIMKLEDKVAKLKAKKLEKAKPVVSGCGCKALVMPDEKPIIVRCDAHKTANIIVLNSPKS